MTGFVGFSLRIFDETVRSGSKSRLVKVYHAHLIQDTVDRIFPRVPDFFFYFSFREVSGATKFFGK